MTGHVRGALRRSAPALVVLTLLLAVVTAAYGDDEPAGGVAVSLRDVRATEGSLIYEPELRPDGQRHINTPRMVEVLSRLNVNTYVFPVTR
jgi:hypothetical protein